MTKGGPRGGQSGKYRHGDRRAAEQGIGVGKTSYPAGRNAKAWLFCLLLVVVATWGMGTWGDHSSHARDQTLAPLHWELAVLTTGQPGKSQNAWHSAFIMLYNPVP